MMGLHSFYEIPLVNFPEDYVFHIGTFLAQMYEQHGPIIRTRSFGDDSVYLLGPEANQFVLVSNRSQFSHHQGWRFVADTFGDGLLTMDGEKHDQHRRMINPAFTMEAIESYLPLMHRTICQRIANWGERGEIDIYEEMRKITFRVAAEALTGLSEQEELDRLSTLYTKALSNRHTVVDENEFQIYIQSIRTELHNLLLPSIQQRRTSPTTDALGMFIHAKDDTGYALDDEQLVAHANILLIAGHETSTSLATFLFWMIVQHRDYEQRILDEQNTLLQRDSIPTLAHIKQMAVLENALKEVERLYPPVGNGPRGASEDFEFHGYSIPKGTPVFYSIAATHLLPRCWEEPTKFDPDRFMPPREEPQTPYSLIGFGGGKRICIGINFAKVEIKAIVSHVIRKYHLELLPDQQITHAYIGTHRLLHGLKMHVISRE